MDARGEVVTGDEILFICADYLKKRGELSGNKVVCTVLSNGGLIKSLGLRGIECAVCDVGDKNVCDEMSRSGAVLGGERSGHVVFSKYESTGDGLVTAIMIMEALVEQKKTVDLLLKDYKSLPQVTVNVAVEDKVFAAEILLKDAEALSKSLGVRLVVRPSGTEEVVRIMAEGENYENCLAACAKLREKLNG